jgi:hypothetical protein
MTKAYYTCPLQAAYMNKEFGVVFDWISKDDPAKKVPQQFVNIAHDIYHDSSYGGRYYVQTDSIPIFEIKAKDDVKMVTYDDYCAATLAIGDMLTATRLVSTYNVMLDNNWYIHPKHLKVIQRDNKPFMWPIFEEE